jgi:hypothetical protein
MAIQDSSNSDSDSSESSSDGGSDSGSGEGVTVNVEVAGTGPSPVPESRSTGSSQTLPTIKSSDDCERGSDSPESSTSVDEASSASDSDSGSDDSGSDDTSNTRKKSSQANDRPQKGKVAKVVNTPKIGSSQRSDGPTAVTKRRRTDETGRSVTTSIIQQPKTSNPHRKGNGQGQPRKTNTPFSRIKVDEIKFADERLKDNTFESRKGAVNDYGAKASANLIVTKGASFRKEKNKKKRGSYRGGDITVR